MRQTFSALVLAVAASALALTGCGGNAQAQDGGNGPGANSPMRAAMEKARDDAKTSAMGDLSADHRAQVQKIVDAVNAGTDTDLSGAVQQVDAILSPDEAKAVSGERDKMMATVKAAVQANGGGTTGGQAGGGATGARRGGGGMMRSKDPGRFLLMVNLSRERMQALRAARQQQSGSN
jgi:hypothetical protein